MKKKTELLPCPWCGGKARIRDVGEDMAPWRFHVSAKCKRGCPVAAATRSYPTAEKPLRLGTSGRDEMDKYITNAIGWQAIYADLLRRVKEARMEYHGNNNDTQYIFLDDFDRILPEAKDA